MGVQIKTLFGGLDEVPAGADPRAVVEGLIRELETDADDEHYQVAVVYDHGWGVTIGSSGLAVLNDTTQIHAKRKRKPPGPLYRRLQSREEAVLLLEDVARGRIDRVRALDWVSAEALPEKTVEMFRRPQQDPFPLHKAAFAGDLEAVRRLLRAGSDMNQRDADGAAPLMHAALEGHKVICRLFIEQGADVTVRDNDGWGLLRLAKRHPEIVAMLKRAGASE